MSDESATFAERALAAMLELLDEGALLFEGEGLVCLAASEKAAAILGLPRQAVIGKARDEVLRAISAGDDATLRALEALRGAGAEEALRETVALTGDPPRTVQWSTAPLAAGGRTVGRVDVLSEQQGDAKLREALDDARAKLQEASRVDELTGLANRKHFELEMDREHRRSQRAWASYAVARIDIDGMGALNAELGRETGDRLLRKIGEELKAPRREYDLVARWEEDELIVLLPGIEPQAVKAVLKRSLSAMHDAARALLGREVTFCVGVALWVPPSVEAANDIVVRAGTALEAAKLMGRGKIEIDVSSVEWKDDPTAG